MGDGKGRKGERDREGRDGRDQQVNHAGGKTRRCVIRKKLLQFTRKLWIETDH